MCRQQGFGAQNGQYRNAPSVYREKASGARNVHCNPFSGPMPASTPSQFAGRLHSIDRPQGPVETIALSSLSHAVSTPPGTKERLLIRLLNVKLTEFEGQDLTCTVSVRPLTEAPSGVTSGVKPPHFFKKKCAIHKGAMEVIMDVGEGQLREACSVHLKFKAGATQCIAEATRAIPQPATQLTLKNAFWSDAVGAATLEVLRLIPGSACGSLIRMLCSEIEQHEQHKQRGSTETELDNLCTSVKELCNSTSARPVLELCNSSESLRNTIGLSLLNSMANLGRQDAAEALLENGVEPTVDTVHAAERAECFELEHRLVERLRPLVAGTRAKDAGLQLVWALQQKLPGLADWIITHFPSTLRNLPRRPGSPAARMAYEAGALSVLAALIKRGDPLPDSVPVDELLSKARDLGNVSLARVCLSPSRDLNADDAVRICLGHERVERRQRKAPTIMVREALEARWRVQNTQQRGCNSSCLTRADGPSADPAECSICFEPLHSCGPSVFLNESGLRSCPHFFCENCVEQVETKKPDMLDGLDELFGLSLPGQKLNCPMCRRTFSETARLPDPTVDPCTFFQYACLSEVDASSEASSDPRKALRLTERAAYDALCAVLPVDPDSFKEEFANRLWPRWTDGKEVGSAGLTEAEFAAPGGMLSWAVDYLMELKVEEQRGQCKGMSVEEALEKARAVDLADRQRCKDRKPKKPQRTPSLQSAAYGSPVRNVENSVEDMIRSMQEMMNRRN